MADVYNLADLPNTGLLAVDGVWLAHLGGTRTVGRLLSFHTCSGKPFLVWH